MRISDMHKLDPANTNRHNYREGKRKEAKERQSEYNAQHQGGCFGPGCREHSLKGPQSNAAKGKRRKTRR